MSARPPRFDPSTIDRLLASADDGLDDARRFLQTLLDHAPLAVAVETVAVDGDGFEILPDYLSPQIPHIFRTEPSFGSEVQDWRRANQEVLDGLGSRLRQLWRDGRDVYVTEVPLAIDDVSTVVVDMRMHLFPELGRLYVYSFDVTDRRVAEAALAENERLLGAIGACSPDVIVVTDLDGNFTYASPNIADALGFEADELVGQSWLDLIHADDREMVTQDVHRLRDGHIDVAMARLRTRQRDGTWIVFDSRVNLLRSADGEILGYLVLTRDAAPQLHLEQVLRDARDEAEQANRAKDEFLSRTSHELRTPLNAVLGFAQLLEQAPLDERDRDSVAHIRQAGAHLLRLLDEVLDLSRIESGTFNIELAPVPLAPVVDEALRYVRSLASAHRVEIQVDDIGDEWVQADGRRLMQVMLNLLSNAVKFNRPDGTVHVAVTSDAEGGRCSVAVTDSGIGLEPSELRQLFVPFERLGADERGVAGSGIGLVLSRSLAERMGGTVRVFSTPGVGSTFVLDLVRAEPAVIMKAVDEPGPSTVPEAARRSLSVLYIEDNRTNRDLIRHVLHTAGDDQLSVAATGREGIEQALAKRPDVVLLDLHLPDMDGIAVMHQLRCQPTLADIPIVIVSADATSRQISRVLAEGADVYLTKPLNIAELLTVLDGYR